MRVLLINPFYPVSETPSPPLGLAYLGAALEEAGAAVRVLDLVVQPYSREGLAALLDEFAPEMVGATAVTMTVDHARRVIADAKRLRPQALTVMGGPHVTFSAAETFAACPELDAVVFGEGERTVVELAQAASRGGDLAGVRGIAYRRGGRIATTAAREPIAELDRLPPPARHLLPLGRYRALGMALSMTTTRGCPHRCIFCVGRRMVGAKVRFRSPVKVVDEFEHLSTLGFRQVNIVDDLFTADRRHCRAVCDEILRRGIRFPWTSFARVDTVSPEVLAAMKAAGCTAVSFGIESANPGILRTIRKGITPAQVVAAVRMCVAAGVTPFASFILGLPGETPQTLAETLAFAKQLQGLGLIYGFHLLAPFPGTEVRRRSAELGLRILTDDWSRYHANRAVVETAEVPAARLDEIAIGWENDYHRYLGDIRKRMEAGRATPEEAGQLEGLERTVTLYDLMMRGAVESAGDWETGPEEQREAAALLEALIRRVAARAGGDAAATRAALEWAFREGHLACGREERRVRWRWKAS
jgi:radical SAM superfamily enzyme YgiQ (UPF0313 family)